MGSRQSLDVDGNESTSTANTSTAPRSSQSKKKRYAKQHQPDWVEEGQPFDPSLKPSPAPIAHSLPTLPPVSAPTAPQPQTLTPSSAVSTISPALSILGSRKYAQISPGHDAPAVHPRAPAAYQAALPPGHQTQNKVGTTDDNALSAIHEVQTISEQSPSQSPSQLSSQPEISRLRRGLSKILRRSK